MPDFSVSSEVAAHVVPGLLIFDGVTVVERHDAMSVHIERLDATRIETPGHAEVVSAVRSMYRRFGIDPTKTRPSSEALLRRVRKHDPFPRVNAAVDVCNWCSVETGLPFGLYDASKIVGDVQLRVGREGEEYAGIRKDAVHVAGRLAVADDEGPFGNPTSDSARTMVTPTTTQLLFVIFAPRSVGGRVVDDTVALTAARTIEYCGGRETLRRIL